MKPNYRVMFERSGESIEAIEPGSVFDWNRLEWFQVSPDADGGANGSPPWQGGSLSIGLRIGHAFQYLNQVQVGHAPLAGVVIETNTLGKRHQLNFRDVAVTSSKLDDGIGCIEFSYELIRV